MMFRSHSLERKNDSSSIMSSTSSIFDSNLYSPDSTFTDYGEITQDNYGKTVLPQYLHHPVPDSPFKGLRSTPRTYSLVHHSSQTLQERTLDPWNRRHSVAGPSLEAPANTGSVRDESAEPRALSLSRRSRAYFEANSTASVANLRYASSVRHSSASAKLRVPQDVWPSSRTPAHPESSHGTSKYLKIKLNFSLADQMLVMKYNKNKLTSVQDLVKTISTKLQDRYHLENHKMEVWLTFSDKSLKKVSLGGNGTSSPECIESLMMDYIHSKSRIYLEVYPIS